MYYALVILMTLSKKNGEHFDVDGEYIYIYIYVCVCVCVCVIVIDGEY